MTVTVTAIDAITAEAEAFAFLNDHLPDRIIPLTPRFDAIAQLWRVPVALSYPGLGALGECGEIAVSLSSGKIVSHTPLSELEATSLALAEKYRDAIEAPLP